MKSIYIKHSTILDILNISSGAYAPLKGFIRQKDYQSVLHDMRLNDGSIWPIPIVLPITKDEKENIGKTNSVKLVDLEGRKIALLKDIEIYPYDKNEFAQSVYGTNSLEHPGVKRLMEAGDYLIGGDVELVDWQLPFAEFYLSPKQTKEIFQQKGWKSIAAFQTRNVPHRGHEFLQLQTLSKVDGLLIHPVIGEKKIGDFKNEYIITAYQMLINHYLPKQRVVFSILPLAMRYAGPKEAVLHAIIRRNYGCTHFIVGRDHAGVGNFYHPFAAQEIFKQFNKNEIGIEILTYDEVVYYPNKKMHDFISAYPNEQKIKFSGTKIRDSITNNNNMPHYYMRQDIYQFLTRSKNTMVDQKYLNNRNNNAFVLWFTGLSQSGKTTIADKVYEYLNQLGLVVERLDGDVVRQSLTADLGFTKEDRDTNIQRVGFVAKLLQKNGVNVVASFISPYKAAREKLKKEIPNFIEIYVSTPLEICEQRDKKGLYEKARRGEIKNFTGISDPYEPPENPEIILKPHLNDLDTSVNQVITFLKKNSLL